MAEKRPVETFGARENRTGPTPPLYCVIYIFIASMSIILTNIFIFKVLKGSPSMDEFSLSGGRACRLP
jgi:hypothetical protein